MIDYDEKWLLLLLTHSKGSVAFRAMLFAFPAAVLAVLLLILDDAYPDLRVESGMGDVSESQTWTAVTAIAVGLLSFRTSQALSRFWEGTGLLHMMRGEWYDSEIKEGTLHEFDTIDAKGLDDYTLYFLKECQSEYPFNRVEALLHMLQVLVTQAHDTGILKIPPPILSRVYQTLSRGFVNLLNAKKISDTRFPFPYAQLIAGLLLFQILLTPIMLTTIIRSKVFAAILSFFVIFGMFALNLIASELENPFGADLNDLPLAHFQNEMNDSLMMLLHPNTDHAPSTSSRCIRDFKALNLGRASRTTYKVPRQKGRSILAESWIVGRESESSMSYRGSDRASSASSVPPKLSFRCEMPAPESAAPPPPVAPPAPEQQELEPKANLVAPAASPGSLPDPHPLVLSMDRLNSTLQQWMQHVEQQAADVDGQRVAHQHLRSTLPAYLDTLGGFNPACGTAASSSAVEKKDLPQAARVGCSRAGEGPTAPADEALQDSVVQKRPLARASAPAGLLPPPTRSGIHAAAQRVTLPGDGRASDAAGRRQSHL